MEKNGEDQEIRDVMQEDVSRGRKRRPLTPDAKRKIRQYEYDALRAIRSKDARAFAEMLRKAGIKEGSPEYVRAWKVFHSGQS